MKATRMAGYLRSALGRASDRILVKSISEEPVTAALEGEQEHVPELNGGEITADDTKNQLEECEVYEDQNMIKEKLLEDEEELARDEKEIEVPGYDVAYDHLPTDDEDELDHKEEPPQDPKVPIVFDVLLHPDAGGFGLNLTYSGCQQRLLVSSFRRLHGNDVGPAEACGKITIDDWLLSVDGEEVKTLEAVHTKLQASGAFVLFRFCRHAPNGLLHSLPSNDSSKLASSTSTSTGPILSFECFQGNNQQLAAMIRELSIKNQLLQDQLNVTKIHLAEKTTQFDDLKAEYSRMKMDSKYIFTTPSRLMSQLYTNSSTYMSKYQLELESVLLEERRRLTNQLTQNFEQEKKQLLKKFETNCTQMEQHFHKKQQMMEQGFAHTIAYVTASTKQKQQQSKLQRQRLEEEGQPKEQRVEKELVVVESTGCSCGALLHVKNELAVHRQEEHQLNSTDNETKHCVVCDLLNEVKQVCQMELVELQNKWQELKTVSTTTTTQQTQKNSHHQMRLDQIVKILKEHSKSKQQTKTITMTQSIVIDTTSDFHPLATTTTGSTNHHFATAG